MHVNYNLGVSLAEAIRNLRFRLGKNQSDFARLINCSQGSASRYEAGEVLPRLAVAIRLRDLATGEEREVFAAYAKKLLAGPMAGRQDAGEEEILAVLLEQVSPAVRGSWEPLFKALVSSISLDRRASASLSELVRLWDENPNAAEPLLRDALGYVRLRLAKGSSGD